MSSNSNLSSGRSDVYAEVDLSKKKKKTVVADGKQGFDPKLNSGIPLYCEISDVHQKTSQLNKAFSISNDGQDNKFSSVVTKDQSKRTIGNTIGYFYQPKKSTLALLCTNKKHVAFLIVFMIIIGVSFILFLIVFVKIKTFESSQREYQQELITMSDNINMLLNRHHEVPSKNETLSNADFSSCADVYKFNSSSSSGYYTFKSSTGQLVSAYCDMTRTCGNITGGWMRVAELDTYNCPSGLRSELVNNSKTCIQSEKGSGCTPVFYSSYEMNFSKVCGRILGYGLGTLDGFNRTGMNASDTPLSGNYLDGISVSVVSSGNGSHVWSLVTGNCSINDDKPPFVGDDFTCTNSYCDVGKVCPDLLWNTTTGEDEAPFFKDLNMSTTADVVMSLCRDEGRNNEDVAMVSAVLYVQ